MCIQLSNLKNEFNFKEIAVISKKIVFFRCRSKSITIDNMYLNLFSRCRLPEYVNSTVAGYSEMINLLMCVTLRPFPSGGLVVSTYVFYAANYIWICIPTVKCSCDICVFIMPDISVIGNLSLFNAPIINKYRFCHRSLVIIDESYDRIRLLIYRQSPLYNTYCR